MLSKIKSDKRGMMAVMLILIVGATALILALSAVRLSMADLQMEFTKNQGGQAFSVAEGCLEESLRKLRIDTSYTGETLNLTTGSCIISVTQSGNDRTITIVGSVNEYTQTLEANITLNGNVITLNSRREI
ncbi:MAG: hypothetical protein WC070_03705 [Candidatus Magasanikbacteria bacterium]